MMDDINKFAKIWDKAIADGVFPKESKEEKPEGPESGADFFGNYTTEDYDMDRPLNECDSKYWKLVADSAKTRAPYENISEERKTTAKQNKKIANKLGSTFNPVQDYTVGKDQEVKVTPNWGVGGKELNDLEELKKKLYDLEVKLNSAGILKPKKKKDADESTILKGMEDLKKQIDDLSNALNGNRYAKDYNP